MKRGGSRSGSQDGTRLGAPLGASLVLHLGVVALLVLLRPSAPAALPPMYRVNIVAAPPGPRTPGVVRPPTAPSPPPEKAAPPPKRAEAIEKAMPLPEKAPPKRKQTSQATPTPAPPKTPAKAPEKEAATAGGGPTGGRGTDVATVRTEGVDFPFPGYLENIVRQIAMRFEPPRNSASSAEVMFLVHRDGTVSNFRFLTRSGNFAFDLEAQGAVDQAAQVKAFGPLPSGFSDDVLPVIFSFDPRVLH